MDLNSIRAAVGRFVGLDKAKAEEKLIRQKSTEQLIDNIVEANKLPEADKAVAKIQILLDNPGLLDAIRELDPELLDSIILKDGMLRANREYAKHLPPGEDSEH